LNVVLGWYKFKGKKLISLIDIIYICINKIYMISIQQMHYLIVLSEERHFQRASERCFVTQPTLSMQVKKAEDVLGYAIFDRGTNPIELTVFGKQLIVICRDVLQEFDKIDIARQKMDGNYREYIRIGIIPTISSYMIPNLFPIWKEAMHDVQIEIQEMKTTQLLEALENKTIDLGILAGPIAHNQWRTIPLFLEEIKAYIPQFDSDKLTNDYLKNFHPWLLSKGNCLRTQMMEFCEISNDMEPNQWSYQGGNIDMLVKMVDLNGGYTLVPSNHVLPIEKRKKLYSIHTKSDNQSPARQVIALLPKRSIKFDSIERLIRQIQHQYPTVVDSNKFQLLGWE